MNEMLIFFKVIPFGIQHTYTNTICMYILKVSVCTDELVLSFLPLCSVLVYHRYTNVNIGPWLVET